MEEGAKRRLVGAAVVVLLLVVFVPMFLAEDTRGPVPEGELAVPERPEFDRGYDATVADDPREGVPLDADAPESQPLPRELPPPVLFDAPASVQSEAESEPAYEQLYELEPSPEDEPPSASEPPIVRQPAPAPKSPPAAKPAPKPAPIPPGVAAWVIQVASVQDPKRAKSLEGDLREKGFPAFIEQAQVKQKLWHRIRVGPEADRKRAESIAASIKAQTGLNVQIQRYP